ncbi:MAG: glycosyltransferase [Acidimicrobiales bacterium]
MRITMVSAHYPPNFVSGGTLQPQRLARGLADRGHEVRVFAGFLDSRRTPLETWTDTDETGLPVDWVVSTPWMGWSDPLNYDNPGVTEVFTQHLRTHRPEVVHLHALQTLGAGLIEAARAAGAATVVTMHDFWWVCARQFLVDRDDRPCSLVVDAGACECEAGKAHLTERTDRLRDLLRSADLVLAPSRSAAEVLRANGISRVEVDENGMEVDPTLVTISSSRSGSDVVARYTGGSNAMKGAAVLLDAVHQLGPVPGLRVVAHGLADAVEADGRPIDDTVLSVAAPYPPEALDEVLAASDALVLPSVMRESHSLVTREALLRGLPVIATDTLGPEEVVAHDRNGAIVPAGDAGALASALLSLTDPGTLARWRTGAAAPIRVRSIDEQVLGLEARFESLARSDGAVPDPDGPAPPHRVLFLAGIDGAPLRYRVRLPAEALALRGVVSHVRHYRDPDAEALAAEADVIVVYRVPATPQVLGLIAEARGRGTAVAFDVDDLIFDPGIAEEIPALRLLPPDEAALWLEGVNRYRTTMEACDAYIGSTPRLVQHARDLLGIDAHLFENGVGIVLGAASDRALRRPRLPGPPRIGYFSGTTTHDDDWRHIEAAVLEALDAHPEVELWLGGHLTIDPGAVERLGDRVKRFPFAPWFELPERLRDLDVNLAPLQPGSRFNDAKSAIKWLEAALVDTPTIASPSAPFTQVIDHGSTGWLADQPTEWVDALSEALASASERRRVGAAARRRALLGWSPHLQGERYLHILAAVTERAADGGRPSSPRWTAVANEEPVLPSPTPLEDYPPSTTIDIAPAAPAIPARRSLTRRVGHGARLVRTRQQEEGWRATAAAIGRVVRRRLSGTR